MRISILRFKKRGVMHSLNRLIFCVLLAHLQKALTFRWILDLVKQSGNGGNRKLMPSLDSRKVVLKQPV